MVNSSQPLSKLFLQWCSTQHCIQRLNNTLFQWYLVNISQVKPQFTVMIIYYMYINFIPAISINKATGYRYIHELSTKIHVLRSDFEYYGKPFDS